MGTVFLLRVPMLRLSFEKIIKDLDIKMSNTIRIDPKNNTYCDICFKEFKLQEIGISYEKSSFR